MGYQRAGGDIYSSKLPLNSTSSVHHGCQCAPCFLPHSRKYTPNQCCPLHQGTLECSCQQSPSGEHRIACVSCGTFTQVQNPLDFILRAAQVYPDKVALVHPNVGYPVQYTFGVWYASNQASCTLSAQACSGRSVSKTSRMHSSKQV